MQEATVPLLTTWGNFYVIVGTAAATLTGLMFVVMTLSTNIRRQRRYGDTLGTFNTPNVVHFCMALLVALLLSAPWTGFEIASVLLGLIGVGGSIYVSIVLRRFTRLQSYKPVLEDWAWHVIIPFACYAALFVSAIALLSNAVLAMFFIGAVLVLFLFVGIHNSWDIVTFITVEILQRDDKERDS